MGEGLVNSFVIRQQFEWAWEGKTFDQPLWHGYDAEDFGYDESIRLKTKELFDQTEVFVLTFGLSEVWYDEPTGNVFWRTVPKAAYDPQRHKFRASTVAENADNMRAIHDLIQKHRPGAKTIFTLSPIPLVATFRDVSCITANSVSKSTLRVAVDEVVRERGKESELYYWPSYEIVTDVLSDALMPDRRHPKPAVIEFIMTLFEHVWCTGSEASKPPLIDAWVRALAACGMLPQRLTRIVARRDKARLDNMIATGLKSQRFDKIREADLKLLGELSSSWTEERLHAAE